MQGVHGVQGAEGFGEVDRVDRVDQIAGTDRVDVVHLHFGFEHRSPAQLRAWVGALAEARIPLVLTVHDLENPHLAPSSTDSASPYTALLDVLVPAAAAITTLTAGAARVIEQRWQRTALVHPHPYLVGDDWLDRERPARRRSPAARETPDPWIVTVHLKSLRANVDLDAVEALRRELARIPRARLRLHVHSDVLPAAPPRHDARLDALVAAAARDTSETNDASEPTVDLRVHEPLTDEALWADLLSSDLAVLPYGFGTHSGWLEMCHDLGTPVLAPDIGHLADQRPIRTWRVGDRADLAAQVARAHADFRSGRSPVRPPGAARRAERESIREVHRALYTRVVAQNSVPIRQRAAAGSDGR